MLYRFCGPQKVLIHWRNLLSDEMGLEATAPCPVLIEYEQGKEKMTLSSYCIEVEIPLTPDRLEKFMGLVESPSRWKRKGRRQTWGDCFHLMHSVQNG